MSRVVVTGRAVVHVVAHEGRVVEQNDFGGRGHGGELPTAARDPIDPTGRPRVAAQQTSDAQSQSAHRAVHGERLQRVCGTGGEIPAHVSVQRGDNRAVELEQGDAKILRKMLHGAHEATAGVVLVRRAREELLGRRT